MAANMSSGYRWSDEPVRTFYHCTICEQDFELDPELLYSALPKCISVNGRHHFIRVSRAIGDTEEK